MDVETLLNYITKNRDEIIESIDTTETSINRNIQPMEFSNDTLPLNDYNNRVAMFFDDNDEPECVIMDEEEITEEDVDEALEGLIESGQVIRTVDENGEVVYKYNEDFTE